MYRIDRHVYFKWVNHLEFECVGVYSIGIVGSTLLDDAVEIMNAAGIDYMQCIYLQPLCKLMGFDGLCIWVGDASSVQ